VLQTDEYRWIADIAHQFATLIKTGAH